MAHIAILSVPAYGHLNPVLPIAKELAARGHRITVFNEASFEPLIRPTGAEFVAYPPIIHLEDFSRTLKDGDLIAWLEMIFLVSGPLLGFVYKTLRNDRPDLIIFDGVALWGEMAATKLRLPSVSISTTFLFEVWREMSGIREFLRYQLSLYPRLPGFAWGFIKMLAQGVRSLPWRLPLVPRMGSEGTIMLTSRAVHPKTPYFNDPRFAFTGCSIEPSTRLEQFDFSRLDGRPLLYVSLGTLHHGNVGFFERCIEVFADYPGQVLLSVGRGTDLTQFSLPANFMIAETVPQLKILEHAHIFLTHAGLNSMHEALWSGVPMVAVPQQFEQLRNAQAMQSAGAGIVIDAQTWGKPLTAAMLRDAVDRLEADRDKYASVAKSLGQTLRDGGGYVEAANVIDRVLAKRSPTIHRSSDIELTTTN